MKRDREERVEPVQAVHPYRSRTTGRFDDAGARALARARCAVFAAIVPLAAIAALFLAPMRTRGYRATPAMLVMDAPRHSYLTATLYVLPPYVAAFALAGLIAAVAIRQRMRRGARSPFQGAFEAKVRRVAWVVVAIAALSLPGFVLVLLSEHLNTSESVLLWGTAAVTGVGLLAIFPRAARAVGWRRWGFLLATFTVTTLPMSILYVLTFLGRETEWGAWAWFPTVGVLAVLSGIAIWPARRSAEKR